MANKKISQLTAIVTVDTAADLFPIVDTSAIETKSITPSALKTALSLNNVDNTTDANKPVSTATQTALNAKQDTLVSATNIKTINSTSILGSGNIVVGATPSGIAGAVQFSDGSAFSSDATNLFWDDTNNRLGIGTSTPTTALEVAYNSSTLNGILINQLGASLDSSIGFAGAGVIRSSLSMNINTGECRWTASSGGYFPTIYSSGVERFRIATSGNVGIGETTPTARLQVKGSGSTSATTSLLVQNSAGTQLLNIRDDGFTTIGQSNQGISTHNLTATNYIVCGSTSSHYFQLGAGLVLRSPSDGVATFLNGGESGFTRINLGGTTSSFPAIKRNAAQIDFKLADDSAYCNITGQEVGANVGFFAPNSTELRGTYLRARASTFIGFADSTQGIVIDSSATTPSASSILQANSTTKGFLPPRMTTTQRNAISSPAEGLMIYNTTTAKLNVYTTAWEAITSL